MVLKFINPAVMNLQLAVVTKAGFEDGPRGAAQFGMSLSRTMEKERDGELAEMVRTLQQEASKLAMEVVNMKKE